MRSFLPTIPGKRRRPNALAELRAGRRDRRRLGGSEMRPACRHAVDLFCANGPCVSSSRELGGAQCGRAEEHHFEETTLP